MAPYLQPQLFVIYVYIQAIGLYRLRELSFEMTGRMASFVRDMLDSYRATDIAIDVTIVGTTAALSLIHI